MAPLRTRSFTVEEFHRMAEAGVFHEDDRVELIDGQIVEMTPIGPRHAGCVKELTRLLYLATSDSIILGIQDPVVLGTHRAPEPTLPSSSGDRRATARGIPAPKTYCSSSRWPTPRPSTTARSICHG